MDKWQLLDSRGCWLLTTLPLGTEEHCHSSHKRFWAESSTKQTRVQVICAEAEESLQHRSASSTLTTMLQQNGFWKIQVRPAASSRQLPLWTSDFQSTLTGGDSATRCLGLTRRNKKNIWCKFEAIGSMLLQQQNHLLKVVLNLHFF